VVGTSRPDARGASYTTSTDVTPVVGAARAADTITLPTKRARVVAAAAAPDGGVNLIVETADWRGGRFRFRATAYGLSPALTVRWRHRVAAEIRPILAAGVASSGEGVVLIARFRPGGPDTGVERVAFDRAGRVTKARLSSRRGDVTGSSLAVAPGGAWTAVWTRQLDGRFGKVALSAAAAPSATAPPTRADELAVFRASPVTLEATASGTGDALISWTDSVAGHAALVTRDLTMSRRLDVYYVDQVWAAIGPSGDALLVAPPFYETDRPPKLRIFGRPAGGSWWREPTEIEMPDSTVTGGGGPRTAAVAVGSDGQALVVTVAGFRRTGRVALVRGNTGNLGSAPFRSFARGTSATRTFRRRSRLSMPLAARPWCGPPRPKRTASAGALRSRLQPCSPSSQCGRRTSATTSSRGRRSCNPMARCSSCRRSTTAPAVDASWCGA